MFYGWFLRRTARFVATSLKYCSAVYAIMKTQEVTEYMFGLAVPGVPLAALAAQR